MKLISSVFPGMYEHTWRLKGEAGMKMILLMVYDDLNKINLPIDCKAKAHVLHI